MGVSSWKKGHRVVEKDDPTVHNEELEEAVDETGGSRGLNAFVAVPASQ